MYSTRPAGSFARAVPNGPLEFLIQERNSYEHTAKPNGASSSGVFRRDSDRGTDGLVFAELEMVCPSDSHRLCWPAGRTDRLGLRRNEKFGCREGVRA